MQGLGALTLCAVENLYITLQSALCKGVPNPWIQPISDHAELFSLKKKKDLHISEPKQFKPMLSKDQLYFIFTN